MEFNNPSSQQNFNLMSSQISAQLLSPMQPDDNIEQPTSVPELSFEQKLHNLIVKHLTDTGLIAVRKMLAPIAETLDCRDILVAEVAMLLGQITRDELHVAQHISEEKLICDVMLKTIEKIKKEKDRQQDDIMTDIIIGLNEINFLSSPASLLLMISSIDSRMIIPLSPKKVEFIKKQLEVVNYKSVKDVVKTAFQELNNLAQVITEKALNDFRPFEEILLKTLDRKNNLSPLLLMQYEISKVNYNHKVYIMRRIADKSREIEKSFRPLATITEIISKPYLFPAFAHPSLTSMLHWKDDNRKITVRVNLPFTTSNQSPQTFFQYTMLKQPWYLVRLDTRDILKERIPMNCTEVLLILILEAMAAMEETDLSIEHPSNQFNWQHLNYVGVVCWSDSYVNFELLLEMLHSQLSELKYRKARGELMRLVLQYVALVQPGSNESGQNDGLGFYNKLKDLYNLLYPEDSVDTSVAADTECLKLVRYFAPAAIWLNFEALKNAKTTFTEPPPNLMRLIKIIKDIMNSDQSKEDGFSTVIANAYTRDHEVFKTKFCANIIKKLECGKNNLPYGKPALKGKSALSVAVLESLNFSASKDLMIYLWNQMNEELVNNLIPSPELIESLARISFIGEINGCLGFMADKFVNVTKEITGKKTSSEGKYAHYNLLMILLEYFSMRLKILFSPYLYIFFYGLYDLIRLFIDETHCINHQLYSSIEHMFIRWFSWCASHSVVHFTQTLTTVCLRRSDKFCLTKNPIEFNTGESYFSPELTKLYIIHLLKTSKLTDHSSLGIPLDTLNYHTFPESSLKWIPKRFKPKLCENMEYDTIITMKSLSNQDINYYINGDHLYFSKMIHSRQPRLFLTLFRIIKRINKNILSQQQIDFPSLGYALLKNVSIRYIISSLNILIDYILYKMKTNCNFNAMCTAVNCFVFEYEFVTFDRFLFHLLVHPNDDESIKNSLEFLKFYIEGNTYLQERFSNLEFLPTWSRMSFCDSTEFFNGIYKYHSEYPERTYTEKSRVIHGDTNFIDSNEHLPIYYSNLLEKLIISVEFLFFRLIEMEISPNIFDPIMDRFKLIFKYHPQPATFLYKTLYCFAPEQIRHDWIRKYVRIIALQDREHKYYLLSECFLDRYEVSTPNEICKTLIDRLKRSTTYKHEPPLFCSKDWRFAELPPAAATLIGANIELMISKYDANTLVETLLKYGFKKPLDKPFEVMNAIGLLLTTLPETFQKCFINKFEAYIEMNELTEEDDPSVLLQSFSINGYLAIDNDPLTALAIIHSYTQHCSDTGLIWLYKLIENMYEKIKTESQLMFLLRIIVPVLSRETDHKRKLDLAVYICNSIMNVVRNNNELKYCDTYCDLLYEVKYVFQITDREKVEELIQNFPQPLKEKMKYFFSSKEEHEAAQRLKQLREDKLYQQQMSQQLLRLHSQQALSHQNSSSLNLLSDTMRSNIRMPLNNDNIDINNFQIRDKIEPEMVAPPIRADALPEMAYHQNIIRPPISDGNLMSNSTNMMQNMNQSIQQHQIRPGMMPMRPSQMMPNVSNTSMNLQNQSMSQGMSQMNPMTRYSTMVPPGQVNPMMNHPISQGYMPPTTTMQSQGNFMPNQPMFMPPNSAGPNQPPNSMSDSIQSSNFGMMGSGQNQSMTMSQQSGLMSHTSSSGMMPSGIMNQPGMQSQQGPMMGGPSGNTMQSPNFQFPPNMRPPMPPYNMPPGGMQPPR